MTNKTILVETRGRVGLITLNRPDALNALNAMLKDEQYEEALLRDYVLGIGYQ